MNRIQAIGNPKLVIPAIGALASGAGHFSFMSAPALTLGGFQGGAAAGFGSGFTGGMVTGTGNSLIQGENIGKALSNGLNSGLWGGAIGGLTGGITGGIRAARNGNDFWSGNGAGGKYGNVPQVDVGRMNYSSHSSLSIGGNNLSHLSNIEDIDRYYLEATRFFENESATYSSFTFPDGTNGYFLEPSGPSSVIEGSGKRIQSGLYKLVTHNGRRWQGVLRLENVSGRSGSLIHPGVVPNHTTGCLIPGLSFIPGTPFTYNTNAILSSSTALDKLLKVSSQYQDFILLLK